MKQSGRGAREKDREKAASEKEKETGRNARAFNWTNYRDLNSWHAVNLCTCFDGWKNVAMGKSDGGKQAVAWLWYAVV